MKFVLNKGINTNGDIIPMEKRGVILASTKEASEARYQMSLKSPRMMGKKLKKEE